REMRNSPGWSCALSRSVPSSSIPRTRPPQRMACRESLMVQPARLESELDRDALARAQLDVPVGVIDGERASQAGHAHAEPGSQPAGEVVLRIGGAPEQLGTAHEEQVAEAVLERHRRER